MALLERYNRSFLDALSLARNRRDRATIYYSKDGVRAVYEVTAERPVSLGSMVVQGHHITVGDIPPQLRDQLTDTTSEDDFVLARQYAKAAKDVFTYNGIDVETGWDVRP